MDCTSPRFSPTRKTLASSEVSNPTRRVSLCTLGKSPRTWARAPGANLAAQPEAAVICVSFTSSPAIDSSSHRSISSSQYTHGGAESGRLIASPLRERLCANGRIDRRAARRHDTGPRNGAIRFSPSRPSRPSNRCRYQCQPRHPPSHVTKGLSLCHIIDKPNGSCWHQNACAASHLLAAAHRQACPLC